MLTERFAPTVYQRAVAKPLSVAAIRQTASQLGEFHTWLMPVDELRALPACVTVARPSVYDKLLAGATGGKAPAAVFSPTKAAGAGAFARRCGPVEADGG